MYISDPVNQFGLGGVAENCAGYLGPVEML